jgi:hypothetical protein
MTFGFEQNNETLAKDINSIDELQEFLSKEVRQFSEFESQLITELKEVKHLESNLKELEIQMKAVNILMKQYNDLNQKLYFEMHKRDIIDIKKCREYMSMLIRIKSELGPLNSKIVNESEKLFLQETHKIYSESENNKLKMSDIDNKARIITSKIIFMDKQIKGIEEGFSQMAIHLNKVEEEQKQNIATNTPIKGFHS